MLTKKIKFNSISLENKKEIKRLINESDNSLKTIAKMFDLKQSTFLYWYRNKMFDNIIREGTLDIENSKTTKNIINKNRKSYKAINSLTKDEIENIKNKINDSKKITLQSIANEYNLCPSLFCIAYKNKYFGNEIRKTKKEIIDSFY